MRDMLMGQYVPCANIDENEVKEYLKDKISSFCGNYVYNCYSKEYRCSDEWKEKELSEKLSIALKYSDIDAFIEHLIGK